MEEHEINIFRKLYDVSKVIKFETIKRGNISKRDRITKNYLFNPIMWDPFGKFRNTTRSEDDLLNERMLEEEDIGRYEAFSEDYDNDFIYANQFTSASSVSTFLIGNLDGFCNEKTLKKQQKQGEVDANIIDHENLLQLVNW